MFRYAPWDLSSRKRLIPLSILPKLKVKAPALFGAVDSSFSCSAEKAADRDGRGSVAFKQPQTVCTTLPCTRIHNRNLDSNLETSPCSLGKSRRLRDPGISASPRHIDSVRNGSTEILSEQANASAVEESFLIKSCESNADVDDPTKPLFAQLDANSMGTSCRRILHSPTEESSENIDREENVQMKAFVRSKSGFQLSTSLPSVIGENAGSPSMTTNIQLPINSPGSPSTGSSKSKLETQNLQRDGHNSIRELISPVGASSTGNDGTGKIAKDCVSATNRRHKKQVKITDLLRLTLKKVKGKVSIMVSQPASDHIIEQGNSDEDTLQNRRNPRRRRVLDDNAPNIMRQEGSRVTNSPGTVDLTTGNTHVDVVTPDHSPRANRSQDGTFTEQGEHSRGNSLRAHAKKVPLGSSEDEGSKMLPENLSKRKKQSETERRHRRLERKQSVVARVNCEESLNQWAFVSF